MKKKLLTIFNNNTKCTQYAFIIMLNKRKYISGYVGTGIFT